MSNIPSDELVIRDAYIKITVIRLAAGNVLIRSVGSVTGHFQEVVLDSNELAAILKFLLQGEQSHE